MKILTAALPPGERSGRREREKAAVRRLLDQLAGPDAPLAHDADGKPHVQGVPFLSITHSQRVAAVAASDRHPFGIDAEEWRPALERVKDRFLSGQEQEWCRDLLRAWAIKEAVYKCAGSRSLTGCEICISPDYSAASARGRSYAVRTWTDGPTLFALAYPILK